MKRMLTLGLLATAALSAQRIEVYSEFRRIDPYGEVVAPDQGGRPREILSPLVARNSHATFHVVTWAPPGEIYYFYASPDPAEYIDVTVYKAMYRETEAGLIPDGLRPIEIPYTSQIPDQFHRITDQKVEMFVVDAWVKPDAPPGRMKLDFQLNHNDHWLIYPMEVRITDAETPGVQVSPRRLPPVTARSDASMVGPVREYVCGVPDEAAQGDSQRNIRSLIRRNVLEDLALARAQEETRGAEVVKAGLLEGLGAEWESFCSTDSPSDPENPEWFLRGRDFLYRGTGNYY
jgi:hypothetical protein